MPMIECSTCGTKYNTDLVDKCPICEYRASESDLVGQTQASDPSTDPATLGQMALSDDPRVAEAAIANPNTPDWAKRRAQQNATTETVGSEPTDGVEVESSESNLHEAGPKDEFVHLKVGDSSSGDSLPSDAEDSPLLRKIIEQNEAQLAQLKAIRKSSKSSETYLLFLAVVYPILGIVGIFFIYLANA